MSQILTIAVESDTIIRIFLLGFMSFLLSMLLTLVYTHYAFKYQLWKRQRSEAMGGSSAAVYKKLHAEKHKRNIPTMAGLIFVISAALSTILFNLNRAETWLPLAGMVAAGAIGFIDDLINIRGDGTGVAGLRSRLKFGLHSIVALIGGWWFWAKQGVNTIEVPFIGSITLGILIIGLFWFIVIATANSVNITDGLDGLAGGLLVSAFAAYALIATVQGQYYLAGFCMAIIGALLSYTWFNIFPARFFMGDTGSFALGTALGIIAVQTQTIFILPVIAAVFVMETSSVIINRTSRKFRNGKKVFISSPIHHHFEAIGWPETKVTMRFWVLGQVAAVLGIVLFLIGRGAA